MGFARFSAVVWEMAEDEWVASCLELHAQATAKTEEEAVEGLKAEVMGQLHDPSESEMKLVRFVLEVPGLGH